MSLQTRRPPGHAKRKALAYTAEILRLRADGHTLSAIRDALEDAGVMVSISTVRRELLKGAAAAAIGHATAALTKSPDLRQPGATLVPRAAPNGAIAISHPTPPATPLPGKAIAEAFMRDRPTNPLFLKEHSP